MKSTATSIRSRFVAAPALAALLGAGALAWPSAADAQPAAPGAPKPAPAAAQPGAQPAPGAAQPGATVAAPAAPQVSAVPGAGESALAVALAPRPGGLTPDEVAQAALRTRASLRVKQAELRAAAARVDQAFVGYFPRVTLTATYTRLSEVDSTLGGGALVGVANEGPVTVGPCPPGSPAATCVLDSAGLPAQAVSLTFPTLNNAYSLVASLAVPISDYVLRISQGYASASHAESAKKLEAQAEALQIAADAKVAFYNWVRAKGQVVVAREAVAQSQAHVADARRSFEVGLLSRADVLRLEAQVAGAEQVLAEAEAFESVADEQIRIALGAPPDRRLEIGVDVVGGAGAAPGARPDLRALQQEALQKRLEIRALDETQHSLKEVEAVTRAGYLPRVDAFADLTYANPNQRVFPQQDKFDLTWDAGVRLTWVVNETFTTIGAVAEARARTAAVAEQKAALRDALRLEVASAYADVAKAESSIEAAARQLTAAEESMRVRTELFRAGRATSVDVVDAETEVTRARLRFIDAHVGRLVARTRLDHAVGRDVK